MQKREVAAVELCFDNPVRTSPGTANGGTVLISPPDTNVIVMWDIVLFLRSSDIPDYSLLHF